MYIILSVVIALLALLGRRVFSYAHRAQYYWRRRGVPGPIGWPLLGNFYDVSDANFPRCFVLNKWTKMFGRTFGYMEGSVPTLVISDVAMVREMFGDFDSFHSRKLTNMIHGDVESVVEEPIVNLFIASGARWKQARNFISQVFMPKNIRLSENTVETSAVAMIDCINRKNLDDGINIHSFFQEFTYDVICRIALGQPEPNLFGNGEISIVKGILLRSHRVLPWYLAVAFPTWQVYIKKMFYNHPNVRGEDVGRLFAICRQAVTARIAEKEENLRNGIEHPVNDFIDEFLQYHVDKIDEKSRDKQATTSDIIGACFVFLLAGFDTTANTLGYAAYLLAKNPKKMEIAQEEINEFVGENVVTYNDTRNLSYVEAVIKEALRLYPVGYFACSRTCTETTTLGGIRVEKGTQVEVDMIAVHKDIELWGENVNDFEPERWLQPGLKQADMPWFPFGGGRRQCVGRNLGMFESISALAHVLRKYDLKIREKSEDELHLLGCTSTSPEAVTLYLEPRRRRF
ncbi:unnamed protein product [Caenorhabditis brenneri]